MTLEYCIYNLHFCEIEIFPFQLLFLGNDILIQFDSLFDSCLFRHLKSCQTIKNFLLLESLYETLMKKVQQSSYLMADETSIPVQTRDKPGSTYKGYHWVYYSPVNKLVCFDYRKGRGRDGPEKFLESFRGILQTDGYNAYNIYENRPGIVLLACMAHARRKFENAKDNKPVRAIMSLNEYRNCR